MTLVDTKGFHMEFLINPNVAYILLVLGSVLTLLAIVTPGSGLLEVGAFFCFVLPVYAAIQNGLNWWALVILLLSILPFVYAIRKPKREWALAISILAMVVLPADEVPQRMKFLLFDDGVGSSGRGTLT